MQITYNILSLSKAAVPNLGDFVSEIVWEMVGTDEEGTTAKIASSTKFDLESSDTSNFIPYENLTENTVVSWIDSNMKESLRNHYNEVLAAKIKEARLASQTVTQFPWSPQVGYTVPENIIIAGGIA